MASIVRLRRSDEVRSVLRTGRRRSSASLVLHAIERGDDGPTRVTVVASRRVGGAVERNRAKRVLREAARVVSLPPSTDLVLVARATTPSTRTQELAVELRGLVERMFETEVAPA